MVFGVVDGLSAAEHDIKTITTGMVALVIGFGFWWIYFDLVGRRPPRPEGAALANWLLSHLPITLSITAAGAAMVSLVGHAHDSRTPASTAWLLSGAVALVARPDPHYPGARRCRAAGGRLSTDEPGDGRGAGAALVAGWVRPAPWLLAMLLVAILSVLWFFAVSRFLRAGVWGEQPSHPR